MEDNKGWKKLIHSLRSWANSSRGKLITKRTRQSLVVLIVGYLFYQIYQIGFTEILAALPRIPIYYFLFVIAYMLLPLSELFIYRIILPIPMKAGFLAFLQKKILNTDVIGYSGEAFLLVWMRENLKIDYKKIFHAIKDNTIISSVASTFTAITLMAIFAATGTVDFLSFISPATGIGLLVVFCLLLIVLLVFGNKILNMSIFTASKVYSIHQIRLIVVYGIEVLNWSLVVPEIPWSIWFTFLAIKIITSRIPFLPSQDILFVAVGMEFSKYMDVSTAAIGGVFLAGNILSKLISLVFFTTMGLSKFKNQESVDI